MLAFYLPIGNVDTSNFEKLGISLFGLILCFVFPVNVKFSFYTILRVWES